MGMGSKGGQQKKDENGNAQENYMGRIMTGFLSGLAGAGGTGAMGMDMGSIGGLMAGGGDNSALKTMMTGANLGSQIMGGKPIYNANQPQWWQRPLQQPQQPIQGMSMEDRMKGKV